MLNKFWNWLKGNSSEEVVMMRDESVPLGVATGSPVALQVVEVLPEKFLTAAPPVELEITGVCTKCADGVCTYTPPCENCVPPAKQEVLDFYAKVDAPAKKARVASTAVKALSKPPAKKTPAKKKKSPPKKK